jgi:hypothetical protein
MRNFINSGASLLPNPGGPVATGPAMFLDFTPVAGLPAPLPTRIVVFVEATACASIILDNPSTRIVLLGTETQPDGCGPGADGDDVTFLIFSVSGNASELFARTYVAPYGYYTLANWAPQPPGTPLPDYMQAFLDAGAVIQPSASGNAGLAPSRAASKAEVLVLLVGAALLVGTTRRITRERSH